MVQINTKYILLRWSRR